MDTVSQDREHVIVSQITEPSNRDTIPPRVKGLIMSSN